jgi:glyoxylase-like metal-dependent hydrolase (beta-lactamase superfamily II)
LEIKAFFDTDTFTMTYVVADHRTKDAVVIDPVLDYDPASGQIRDRSIKILLAYLQEHNLKVHYILETHAHADHISGAHQLVEKFYPQAKIGIGRSITTVQETFKAFFDMPADFPTDGRQFDRLFADREQVSAGSLTFQVLFTPGHTPACVSYLFDDAVFTGDALFMPDSGTGRCDFPKGDATALYNSIARVLYKLPDATRVFVGHDYQPGKRELKYQTSIAESKAQNIQLKGLTSEEEYVAFRKARDKTLGAPRLLFPSIQVNIAAGEFPKPGRNGTTYLKVPVFFE